MDSIDNSNDDVYWCPVDYSIFVEIPNIIASMGIADKRREGKSAVVKNNDTKDADGGDDGDDGVCHHVGHNF